MFGSWLACTKHRRVLSLNSSLCFLRDFPHSLIASILVSLSLKDSRAGLKFLLGAEGGEG